MKCWSAAEERGSSEHEHSQVSAQHERRLVGWHHLWAKATDGEEHAGVNKENGWIENRSHIYKKTVVDSVFAPLLGD